MHRDDREAAAADDLTDLDREVRAAVYRRFVDEARAPSTSALAERFGLSDRDVEHSLVRLQAHRTLVLSPGTSNIWMAHPFSAVPTAFRVATVGRTYWANCAWDALAIPSLLGVDATIDTSCGDCGEAVTIRVRENGPLDTDLLVHFLVPPRRFWENIAFT